MVRKRFYLPKTSSFNSRETVLADQVKGKKAHAAEQGSPFMRPVRAIEHPQMPAKLEQFLIY
jgi:hypothetical protein